MATYGNNTTIKIGTNPLAVTAGMGFLQTVNYTVPAGCFLEVYSVYSSTGFANVQVTARFGQNTSLSYIDFATTAYPARLRVPAGDQIRILNNAVTVANIYFAATLFENTP